MNELFEKFITSDFGLEIRSNGEIIFQSKKEGIAGLLEFIDNYGRKTENLVVFDTKIGNAAALLCVYAGVKEIFAVLGSEEAKKTLDTFNIKFFFQKTISCILNKTETDICPMEKLSISKAPEEFYLLVK